MEPERSAFAQIGGAATVDALVEQFYAEMDRDPAARALRGLHASDLSAVKSVLKSYLGEWLGGPPLYSQSRGHPRLRMRHLRFPIGAAERDAWLACMAVALERTIDDPALSQGLYAAFARLADHMRNQPDVG